MKRWYTVLATLIIVFGLIIRFWGFAERSPFDWDQNRDYQVISLISAGKMTLIGPVAKGEGGFFLGPWYYYLATPAFILMHGNPRALPVTSITLDVLAIAAMLILLPKVLGRRQALFLAAVWSSSWFAIEMSRISWNVALIPLWSVIMLWLLSGNEKLSYIKVLLLGCMTGLTWHIHAALIPITPLIILLMWNKLHLRWTLLPFIIVGYMIPLLPLMIFNLRHAGLEWYLMRELFRASSHTSFSFTTLLSAMLLRLGKNTESILIGISTYNFTVGCLTLAGGILGILNTRSIYRVAGLFIVINFIAVLGLHESGFPEYYFAASYLPTLILFFHFLTKIAGDRIIFSVIILCVCIGYNVHAYSYEATSFALSQKESVAHAIASLHTPVDLRLELAPGREGGIVPIFVGSSGTLDPKSHTKVIVSDKGDGPLYINGELTTDLAHYGGLRVATVIIDK